MNKITIKTSDKVEVTKEQARAIEEGMKFYLKIAEKKPEEVKEISKGDTKDYARKLFVSTHILILAKEKEPWTELFEPLNSMRAYELNGAILKGYIVKEDDEEYPSDAE